ncbi:MAG: chromate efflux transporter [Pseudomonadota bacterium]|nr:chromate efflux transporter [Pseudomonadota bacterium]
MHTPEPSNPDAAPGGTRQTAGGEVSLAAAFWVWFRIGWLGFGGPAGQIALMHRELVERRRWISEPRFLHALNYCMLLPGPEAQQLAVYIGWLMHRVRGGLVAGILFVVPGVIVLAVLSWIYVRFGNTSVVTALFFGLKAAVLALVVEAVVRIGRRAMKTRFLVTLAAASFLAIHVFDVAFPLIVLGAAVIGLAASRWAPGALAPTGGGVEAEGDASGYVVDRQLAAEEAAAQPALRRSLRVAAVCVVLWFAPVLLAGAWLGGDHVVTRQGWFFSQAAVVTFGGAYAVLAYVAQRAVEDFAWLQPGEMVDGLALAETTPGPLIMVLQFVGFVAAYRYPGGLDPWAAAALGALMTTWVTFVPSFLFIFVGAPYVEALRRNVRLQAALQAITAAVVGVIVNLSVWFALHTVFGRTQAFDRGPVHLDVPVWSTLEPGALVLSAAALVAMLRFHLGLARTLAGSAILGATYWWLRYGG